MLFKCCLSTCRSTAMIYCAYDVMLTSCARWGWPRQELPYQGMHWLPDKWNVLFETQEDMNSNHIFPRFGKHNLSK